MVDENNWDGLINEVKEATFKRIAKGVLDEPDDLNVPPEEFEFLNALEGAKADDFESQLVDCHEFVRLFVQNKFDELEKRLKEKAAVNMFYAYPLGLLYSIKPVLTMNEEDVNKAKRIYRHVIELCNKHRKPGVMKLFFVADHDEFTDEEAHAELLYAESLMPIAALTVLPDHSIPNMVLAAARIKLAHQSFKLCNKILKYKKKWKSEFLRRNFESAVRLAMAGFQLGVAYLPARYSKILFLAGFTGNKAKGMAHLRYAYEIKDAVTYPAAAGAWVGYHAAVEYFLGIGDSHIELYESFAREWQERAEGSLPVTFGLGALAHLKGNFDEAIKLYEKCMGIQDKVIEIHYASYAAIALCHVTDGKWNLAIENMNHFKDHKKWSPALITYCYALLLHTKAEEEASVDQQETVLELMRQVPMLKKHIGGRLAFHEKIVLDRAKAYTEFNRPLLMPIIELMYIWNYLYVVANEPKRISAMLERIKRKIAALGVTPDTDPDSYAFLVFLKGVMYKHLKRSSQAFECFQEALNCEKHLKYENQIPPQAAYETALVYRSEGQLQTAKRWLSKVRKYPDYPTKLMVDFRAETALNALKEEIREKAKQIKLEKKEKKEDSNN